MFRSSNISAFLCLFALHIDVARSHEAYSPLNCVPENNVYIPTNSDNSGMTRDEFEKISILITERYEHLAKNHGAELVLDLDWENPRVNAHAFQIVTPTKKQEWHIWMLGGLARHPLVTNDAFALVVCHEVGHHFAGFPFYPLEQFSPRGTGARVYTDAWASVEGQADYFATQHCLKTAWKDEHEENIFAFFSSPKLQQMCSSVENENINEIGLCVRMIQAGQSITNLFAVLNHNALPSPFSPTSQFVDVTYALHPNAQCRLDTYVQGAQCKTQFEEEEIPGRNKQRPYLQYTLEAQNKAFKSSCGVAKSTKQEIYVHGARPNCWFGLK